MSCILYRMSTPDRADPTIYPKLRDSALKSRFPNLSHDAVHVVLMDWRVSNGMATVLAAVDGSASIYFDSGGGYIGGGQKFPEIREAALQAIQIATGLSSQFEKSETFDLPKRGNVYFYLTTNAGAYRAVATETKLSAGTDPLGSLGGIMQRIITEYRLKFPHPSAD
jgi:hypothetical protein